jgi:hypothetical protein
MLAGTFFFVSLVTADKIKVADPPKGLFYEQYYALYLGQTKCGWANYLLERKNDTIQGSNTIHMEVGRDNLTISVEVKTQTEETLAGRPLSFDSRVLMAGSETIYRGRFDGKTVHMTVIQNGQGIDHQYTVPADTTMMWGDYLELRKHLSAIGVSYFTHSFDPTLGPEKIITMETQNLGPAKAKIAGKMISGLKILAKADLLGPTPVFTYVDPDGNMLATEMQMGFFKVQMVADTKENVLAKIKPEEIFTNTFVKLSKPLAVKADKPLLLKISAKGEADLPPLPETPRQKIISHKAKSIILEILPPGDTYSKNQNSTTKPEKPEKVYLMNSSYVNLNDPLLAKLATEAAGKAKTPADIAANLCHFVHNYIQNKNLATPFACAGEVAKTKSGDCTEHAVLLAALARIKNIPSRAVAGLVYTTQGGPMGAFGYHMWTQLRLNGEWVDVDGTFDQSVADQTHIVLSQWDLADTTYIDQAVKLVHYIGRMKIVPMMPEGPKNVH